MIGRPRPHIRAGLAVSRRLYRASARSFWYVLALFAHKNLRTLSLQDASARPWPGATAAAVSARQRRGETCRGRTRDVLLGYKHVCMAATRTPVCRYVVMATGQGQQKGSQGPQRCIGVVLQWVIGHFTNEHVCRNLPEPHESGAHPSDPLISYLSRPAPGFCGVARPDASCPVPKVPAHNTFRRTTFVRDSGECALS